MPHVPQTRPLSRIATLFVGFVGLSVFAVAWGYFVVNFGWWGGALGWWPATVVGAGSAFLFALALGALRRPQPAKTPSASPERAPAREI
ncbi:MAG: hypothetical protein ACK41C_00180 [Phenylobacterium sp.]|uniref:hypothetical protein n=1 Tax=Phenylobacterium sp. TaxID=1871053 RepID=UPI00391C7FCA